MSACRGCGKEIIWGEYEKTVAPGEMKDIRVPMDPSAPVYRIVGTAGSDGTVRIERDKAAMVSHFATCPKASQFRGGKKA